MTTSREYKEMVRNRNYWRDAFYKLKDENDRTENKLSDAEFKIQSELEPRIKREEKGYDMFVLSGGSNICDSTGIMGGCGENCEWYDTKDCHGDFT